MKEHNSDNPTKNWIKERAMKEQTVPDCWKVVRVKEDGTMSSAITTSKVLSVTYAMGKWTKAKVGRLMAFSRRADAHLWRECLLIRGTLPEASTILPCKAKDTVITNICLDATNGRKVTAPEVKRFWDHIDSHSRSRRNGASSSKPSLAAIMAVSGDTTLRIVSQYRIVAAKELMPIE